jgi:hypothetical protein
VSSRPAAATAENGLAGSSLHGRIEMEGRACESGLEGYEMALRDRGTLAQANCCGWSGRHRRAPVAEFRKLSDCSRRFTVMQYPLSPNRNPTTCDKRPAPGERRPVSRS